MNNILSEMTNDLHKQNTYRKYKFARFILLDLCCSNATKQFCPSLNWVLGRGTSICLRQTICIRSIRVMLQQSHKTIMFFTELGS